MKVGFFLMHPYSKQLTQSLATTIRIEELSLRLIKKGIKVYVMTPYDSDFVTPEGINVVQIRGLLGEKFLNLESRVKLYNLTRRIYHSKTLHKLFLKLLLKSAKIYGNKLAENVLKICKQHKIDVLHAIQDNAAFILMGIKHKLDIPLLLDLNGVWLEEALANRVITPHSPEYYALKALENKIFENVDMVTVIGEEMYKYVISEFKISNNRVRIIPQAATPFNEEKITKDSMEKPKVVYSGILSYRKNVKLLIDSIPYVLSRYPNTLFLVTKKGDLLSYFTRMSKYYVKNVEFFFFSDREKLMRFLQSCDIGLITNIPSRANKIDMPSKLFEYMAAGLPVVTNETGGWTTIIKRNNIGIVTRNDPKEFAESIIFLIENPEERIRMGKKALELVKEVFNWDKSAELLYKLYMELMH